MTASNQLAGSGFNGAICACFAKGRKLKRRYKKQADAIADATKMPLDAWVYPCPTERRIWHVTTHPIKGGTYVAEAKK